MWVYWVASVLLSAVIGGLLGRRVGKVREGVMLGVLLGPIGWVGLCCSVCRKDSGPRISDIRW